MAAGFEQFLVAAPPRRHGPNRSQRANRRATSRPLNVCSYVEADPINFTDPFGLTPVPDIIVTGLRPIEPHAPPAFGSSLTGGVGASSGGSSDPGAGRGQDIVVTANRIPGPTVPPSISPPMSGPEIVVIGNRQVQLASNRGFGWIDILRAIFDLRGDTCGSCGPNVTVIDGVSYSQHALQQMTRRGIYPSVVRNTIAQGAQTPGNSPGTTVYFDSVNNVTVVTNSSTGVVITAYRGGG